MIARSSETDQLELVAWPNISARDSISHVCSNKSQIGRRDLLRIRSSRKALGEQEGRRRYSTRCGHSTATEGTNCVTVRVSSSRGFKRYAATCSYARYDSFARTFSITRHCTASTFSPNVHCTTTSNKPTTFCLYRCNASTTSSNDDPIWGIATATRTKSWRSSCKEGCPFTLC